LGPSVIVSRGRHHYGIFRYLNKNNYCHPVSVAFIGLYCRIINPLNVWYSDNVTYGLLGYHFNKISLYDGLSCFPMSTSCDKESQSFINFLFAYIHHFPNVAISIKRTPCDKGKCRLF